MRFSHTALVLVLCTSLLGACATAPRTSFTEADQIAAVPTGNNAIRYWADTPASAFQGGARRAIVPKGRPFIYLALSGGGGSGAYGAGILNGWTQSGTRPEFTMVSGVSTGALIAPFAFLGPAYDDTLKQMYTSGEAKRLIEQPNPLGAIFGPGLFGRLQLRRLVERYIDEDFIRAIAREDQKGRRLLVVTTDLDAQRAVIWDLGAIASRGGSDAYKLFRDVLASMSEDVRCVSAGTQLLFMARDIERIGDLATDVAEMASYLVLGEPVEDDRPKADRTKSIVLPASG